MFQKMFDYYILTSNCNIKQREDKLYVDYF